MRSNRTTPRPDRTSIRTTTRVVPGLCSRSPYATKIGPKQRANATPALTTPTLLEVVMADLSPITVARFWSKVSIPQRSDDCWTWTGAVAGSGYGSFNVPAMGSTSAHRIAYRLVNGEWPGYRMLVRHKCDNPRCVNPDHLETGNHVDNANDMIARGRGRNGEQAGEQNGHAKLTADDVNDVRQLIESGLTNIAIAERFGVHHATISAIRRGRSWAA